MDTTENKTEQYTKREYPKFKPAKNGKYDTDLGQLEFSTNGETDFWAYVKNQTLTKLPTYFFDPSPMEVKDAEELRNKSFDIVNSYQDELFTNN